MLHPGYPMAIEWMGLMFDDGVLAGQVVSLLAGSLLVFPLYYLSRYFLSQWLSFGVVAIVVLMNMTG